MIEGQPRQQKKCEAIEFKAEEGLRRRGQKILSFLSFKNRNSNDVLQQHQLSLKRESGRY